MEPTVTPPVCWLMSKVPPLFTKAALPPVEVAVKIAEPPAFSV